MRQRISQLNLIKQKLGKASLKHNLTSVHTKMVTWYGYPLSLTHEWKQFIISIGFALEQTSVIEKLSQILGNRTPLSSTKQFFLKFLCPLIIMPQLRILISFEVRERNPSFVLGVLCLIGCPVQLIREVFLRLHFRRRRHTFASL